MAKKLPRLIGVALVPIVLLLAGLYSYGRSLPEWHQETMVREIRSPRLRVWTAITDYKGIPSWWDEVKQVEEETRPDGTKITWNTDRHGHRIGYLTTEEIETRKLTRKILDNGLPFGGTWTFELLDQGDGTTLLTLEEDGFIRPPLMRAYAKLFMGKREMMESFVAALSKKLE